MHASEIGPTWSGVTDFRCDNLVDSLNNNFYSNTGDTKNFILSGPAKYLISFSISA